MPTSKKPSSALVVIDDLNASQLAQYGQSCSAASLATLGRMARAQFDRIHADERNLPIRGAFLGCVLIGVRAACEQGEWLSWLKEHFGKSQRTAYDYINVGEACIERMKLRLPEFVSLPQLSLELTVPEGDDDARSALRKITKFVGDRSLRELVADCREEKKRGGPKPQTEKTQLQLRQEHAAAFAARLLDEKQRKYFEACELDQQESLMVWWPITSSLNEELVAKAPSYAALPPADRANLADTLRDLLTKLEPKA